MSEANEQLDEIDIRTAISLGVSPRTLSDAIEDATHRQLSDRTGVSLRLMAKLCRRWGIPRRDLRELFDG